MRDVTHKIEIGDTDYFEIEFHAGDFSLADPITPTYEITNKQGASIQGGPSSTLFKRADGIWFVFHTPSKIGDYMITFSAIQGTSNEVKIRRRFKVIETKA